MSVPTHVAIIMDGNGRWAAGRGLPRIKGHKEGARRVEEILEAASDLGIRHLSLYAFSTENWRRPALEVQSLMAMLRIHLRIFRGKCLRHRIRFHHLGDPEGLPAGLVEDLRELEAATATCTGLTFHLAVNYGSRLELLRAVQGCLRDGLQAEALDEAAFGRRLWTVDAPDVDLLIRTSGECRLSNFLLWQSAYAEWHVTETLWPDFRKEHLETALEDYGSRVRRYGGL